MSRFLLLGLLAVVFTGCGDADKSMNRNTGVVPKPPSTGGGEEGGGADNVSAMTE